MPLGLIGSNFYPFPNFYPLPIYPEEDGMNDLPGSFITLFEVSLGQQPIMWALYVYVSLRMSPRSYLRFLKVTSNFTSGF